ncbi:hypothetical protein GRI39_02130 [Altererythrobacter indicus]|uniref:Uncharacterized protein n=1 Tax=Altericroceibacterium indicum TaxID=374177 RepID=A0A845A7P5_9SPHN|nr:hypothetical protein [Altericroceibacterium indicum]MXP24845.1 hypothetical protein [Altericroceibacterium indicum]
MSRAALTYGERQQRKIVVEGAIDVSKPVEGFYRIKLRSNGVYVGIRLWYGPPHDPVTGEEMDRSWRWQALANGEEIDLDRVWPVCARHPITEEEYHNYERRQRWARESAPETAFADPSRRHDPLTAMLPF